MRRLVTAAALVAGLALAGPSLAQTPAPAPAQAGHPGLPIADMVSWLNAKGVQVSPLQRQGEQAFVTVQDAGLTWVLFFYSCRADVCGDVQFSAFFSNPEITLERINDWNREQRFLKAFFATETTGERVATVQYDAVLFPALGVDQLGDHAQLWTSLLAEFGTHIGYFAAEGEEAPATPPAAPQ
jgi:hypothetical protein